MENMSESEDSSSIDHDFSNSELSFDFEKYSESLTRDYEDLDSWLAAAYRRERAQEEEQEECFEIV